MATKVTPIPKGVTVLGTSNGIQHLSNGTYRLISSGKSVPAASLGEARKQLGVNNQGTPNTKTPLGSAQTIISNKTPLTTPQEELNAQFDMNGKIGAQGNTIQDADVFGPGGSTVSTVDPNTGKVTTVNTLSDANQKDLSGLQNSGIAAGTANTGLINSAFNSLSGNPEDYKMSPYEQAIYGKLTNNLSKQQKQETDALKQDLSNRGIPIGSNEYNSELGNVSDKYNNYFQQASDSAVSQGAGLTNSAINTLTQTGQAGFYKPDFQAPNTVNYASLGVTPNVNQDVNTQGQLGIGQTNAGANVISANAAMKGAGAQVTNSQTNQALATLAAQNQNNPSPNQPQPNPPA